MIVQGRTGRRSGWESAWFTVNQRCLRDWNLVEMNTITLHSQRLRPFLDRRRLVDTALRLIEVPSRTGEAGAVSDRLAEILTADGFQVERPEGGHAASPAVAVRFGGGQPGRVLQFDGHLDTVHLPFVPPREEGGRLLGSGSSDMKGGIAAAVEALRALRDADALPGGSILLTAHDLHEAPWGDGSQLDRLIAEGYVGDAVLIPEPLHDILPVVGKGSATWKVTLRREGPPVHEVMRPPHEPSVIAAGAVLVARLAALSARLAAHPDPVCGPATVFVGQFHSGEIFNQYPQDCMLEGTRRWLPGAEIGAVRHEFQEILDTIAHDWSLSVACEWRPIRDAFSLDQADALVSSFRRSYEAIAGGPIATGPKPFVDDGSSFWAHGRIAAITHGPRAGGQHTLNEWVDVDDLVRVAHLYALTAMAYCAEG